MPHDPEDSNDPLSPLLSAAFAARERRVEARGTSVVAQLCLSQGIQPTPLAFGSPTPDGSWERNEAALPTVKGARYQILEELGRGGLGLVMRSRDVDLRRDVALKVLRSRLSDRKDLIERFLLEAQLGAQLQHPGIAPVYDLGIAEDGRPFFTMKLVQGSSLAALLDACAGKNGEGGETVHLLGIFSQVCKAVGYAHARGVVHRDLKPANVMVGEFGEVQVVDWGLAKIAGHPDVPHGDGAIPAPDLSAEPQSRPGTVIGTPGYMSPEQSRGETAGPASDVYSLGVMLFEILAERPLAKFGDGQSLTHERVRELLSEHDADLRQLTQACLASDPSDRPHDALEVGRRIDAHMTRSEERVRRAELSAAEAAERTRGERKARRLTLALASSVILAGTLGVAGWQWTQAEASSRRLDAERGVRDALADAAVAEERRDWSTARAALGLARGSLTAELPSTDLRERVTEAEERVELAVADERRETQRLAQVETLMQDLEEVRLLEAGLVSDTLQQRVASYAAAFSAAGIDLEGTQNEGRAADWLKSTGHGDELAVYLDEWARLIVEVDGEWSDAALHLVGIAMAADQDEDRRSIRDAMVAGDREALRALVADAGELPVQTSLTLAKALHGLGDTNEAVRALERALDEHPGDYEAHSMLGVLLLRIGREDALLHITVAQALRPDSSLTAANLAVAQFEAGAPEKALSAARKAVALDPGRPGSYVSLGGLLSNMGLPAEALEAFRRAEELEPSNPIHANNCGGVLRGLGRPAEALEFFRRANELQPDQPDRLYGMAACLENLHEIDEAMKHLERALELDPRHEWSLMLLGWIQCNRGDAEGMATLRRAVEFHPRSPIPLWNLGIRLEEAGQHEEAERVLKECIAAYEALPDGLLVRQGGELIMPTNMAPNLALVYDSLGLTVHSLGRTEESVALLRRAVELDPRDYSYLYNLGMYLDLTGSYSEARDALLQAYPRMTAREQPIASPGLARFLALCPDAALRDADRAGFYGREAVRLDPENAEAWSALGSALYRQGNHDGCLEALERWEESESEKNATLMWLVRAMALNEVGWAKEARGWFDRAVARHEELGEQDPYFDALVEEARVVLDGER